MLKKVLVVLLALLLVGGGAMIYLNHRNRTLSPPGAAQFNQNGLSISVAYSRPSVRERLIFGREEDDALVPYGEFWRFGANEATEITFEQDVLFSGNPLEACTYRLYAVPGETEFVIGVNSELGRWGIPEPNYDLDLFTFKAKVIKLDSFVHQFTITFSPFEKGAQMNCDWANTRVVIPIEKQS